jgi:hypothetical protein
MIKNYLGTTLEFIYDENYSIIVTYKQKDINKNKYIATMILYDKDTDSSRTMEDKIEIDSSTEHQDVTSENIEDIITEYMKKYIEKLDSKQYLNKYIEKHEEEIRLLNLGVELSEWMKHEGIDYHEWLEHHKIS